MGPRGNQSKKTAAGKGFRKGGCVYRDKPLSKSIWSLYSEQRSAVKRMNGRK